MVKCKLCKLLLREEDLQPHWLGEHPEDWNKVKKHLDVVDQKIKSIEVVAAEGMVGYKEAK